ncbi:MAG: hypothetical protein EOO61_12940 [Hymenobacter sp.]|nr:MAG: hypothetical protein EOO61_12940 [Hymenobacter sp.]
MVPGLSEVANMSVMRNSVISALFLTLLSNAAFAVTLPTGGKVPVPTKGAYLSAYDEDGQKYFEELVQKKIAVGMFYVDFDMENFPKDFQQKYLSNVLRTSGDSRVDSGEWAKWIQKFKAQYLSFGCEVE